MASSRDTHLYGLHLLLILLSAYTAGVGGTDDWWVETPRFGRSESKVEVEKGETARLPCVVLHLNDRSVTWLRKRDLHILTAGHHTYSADDRFKVVHTEGSNEWTLVVRFAQLRDAGVYECQVNTDPKLSKPVTLDVLDEGREVTVTKTKVFVANNTASTKDGHLRVEIQGPRELYIQEGSSLHLTCLVTSSRGPSTPVYWYHDTNLIDYNSPRGGVNLKSHSVQEKDEEEKEQEEEERKKNVEIDRENEGMFLAGGLLELTPVPVRVAVAATHLRPVMVPAVPLAVREADLQATRKLYPHLAAPLGTPVAAPCSHVSSVCVQPL